MSKGEVPDIEFICILQLILLHVKHNRIQQ